MFYNLLSWENPRATAIAYLLTVAAIFATRYLPVIRTVFRLLYVCLGVTATAEIAGKVLFNNGLATQVRPRRYYTLPKGAVDRLLDDAHELMNFFVIEFQRLVFAENVAYTVAAFFGSLIAYYLTKVLPKWGLSLLGTTILYLAPLVYVSNKEFIDERLDRMSHIMNEQAVRAKAMAGQHTARATEKVKTYSRDYSTKAQDLIGSARQPKTTPTQGQSVKDRTVSATGEYSAKGQEYAGAAKDRVASATGLGGSQSSGAADYSASDFPSAPESEPNPGSVADEPYGTKLQEPLMAS